MAHVQVSALSKQNKDELVVTYAALLLHDGDLEITEEKLNKVISASGNSVEGYWPGLFAKALKGRNINDLIANAAASSGPATAAPVAATTAAAPAEAKKEAVSKYYFVFCSLRFYFWLSVTMFLQNDFTAPLVYLKLTKRFLEEAEPEVDVDMGDLFGYWSVLLILVLTLVRLEALNS